MVKQPVVGILDSSTSSRKRIRPNPIRRGGRRRSPTAVRLFLAWRSPEILEASIPRRAHSRTPGGDAASRRRSRSPIVSFSSRLSSAQGRKFAMLAPVARFLALLACAAVLLIAQPASAIDAKCSACSAVASELGEALEAERPRNHLDMRGRLDSKGQRYGKLIDYKVSELRFVELLEGLCASVASKYRLDASVAASDEQPGAEWTKGRRPKGAAGKAMRAEIEGYCHRLVEEQEEALQAALYAGELDPATAEEKMCRDFAPRDCEGEPRKPPPEKEKANESKEAPSEAKKPKKKGGKKRKAKGETGEKAKEKEL